MAAHMQRQSLPNDDERPVVNGGRNTIISHGGKWHNLGEILGRTADNNSVASGATADTSNSVLQDGKGKDKQMESAEGRKAQDMNAWQAPANNAEGSSGRYRDSNGAPPHIYGVRQKEHEVWDASSPQVHGEEHGTQASPPKILEFASSPLPVPISELSADLNSRASLGQEDSPAARDWASTYIQGRGLADADMKVGKEGDQVRNKIKHVANASTEDIFEIPASSRDISDSVRRPGPSTRTVSTPLLRRRLPTTNSGALSKEHTLSTKKPGETLSIPPHFETPKVGNRPSALDDSVPSPVPAKIPMPPLSLPTYLHLELSSHPPSSMYIHRSAASDFPYESSRVKLERLWNFFLLPPQLERVLGFGALACLDAWLYSFTILPLRFLKALTILGDSWGRNLIAEARFIGFFVYTGLGRMWRRKRRASLVKAPEKTTSQDHDSDEDRDKAFLAGPNPLASFVTPEIKHDRRYSSARRHRRSKSTPSALLPDHKADILKGLLIILTCVIMMYFDPSRMYHGIRGQAAIKLYVIYNVLEVCDRLFSALGQDVLECLFSKETLERKSDGRSKILRPLWLFTLALAYNLIHATALFYQVITLNVAVNSYSNALLTLLMSNQFVEIKSTVFKKFEKENLFQITCADVVERFQLWLMLTIIATRNIVETGTLMPAASSNDDFSAAFLPKAFTLEVIPFLSGQVIGPYLIVLGSEMLVDWLKHAYITKFNMTKPAIYGRFLDVLCKDYYSNAFATQNLTRRIGLPVIPLACLFIRASVQTYHMFLAAHMPSPLPSSPSLASISIAVPAPTALFSEALSSFLNNFLPDTPTHIPFTTITPDALLTLLTIALAFLLIYLTLLSLKLLLGMALLHFARKRYRNMKELEKQSFHADGRRVGGWGIVEVDEDKKRWIYADDPDGLRNSREKESQARKTAAAEGGGDLMDVDRYSMVAKRIW